MIDQRGSWLCREVIDDEPERYEPAFSVYPYGGSIVRVMSMTDAAEIASQRIDDQEEQAADLDCSCWRSTYVRLIEVHDGTTWHRFRVRCTVEPRYEARTT